MHDLEDYEQSTRGPSGTFAKRAVSGASPVLRGGTIAGGKQEHDPDRHKLLRRKVAE